MCALQKEIRVRAVFFDAVGTLIHPEPPAATVYTAVGQQFGSRMDEASVRRLFRDAFARQEALDRADGWRTSETREVQRWQSIVGEVLHDASDPEGCFAALYDHFARPSNWQCDRTAGSVIEALGKRGCRLGLASNFDRRLRGIAAANPALINLRQVVISSEVGWRKPAKEFFAAVAKAADVNLQEILYVGDDPVNDYQGAVAAGCRAVLFDRAGRMSAGFRNVHQLSSVVDWLDVAHVDVVDY